MVLDDRLGGIQTLHVQCCLVVLAKKEVVPIRVKAHVECVVNGRFHGDHSLVPADGFA